MIGHYISLIFSGNSIYRWNNFPRAEKITETDNISFVLHIALTLHYTIKEKENIDTDLNYIFKKITLTSFTKFVLSDIDSSVKNRLANKDPLINKELENTVLRLLLKFEAPDSLTNDIKNIYEINKFKKLEKYKIEDEIISFAKLWASYYESYFNSKIYDFYYEEVSKDIVEKINDKKYSLYLKYLPLIKSPMPCLSNFLLSIRRLQGNKRWNKLNRVNEVSVMSHLFIVFFIAYLIGVIEGKKEHELIEMMKIGLYHDITEAVTGDIVTTTKRAVKGFEEALTQIEKEMIEEQLFSNFDGFKFVKDIKKYIHSPWSDENGKLVKIADIFSALFEAKQEVGHNNEFKEIYKTLKRKLQKYDYKSVHYLLNFGDEYFDDNMDEIIKEHFKITL